MLNQLYFIFLYLVFTQGLPFICIPISVIHYIIYYIFNIKYIGHPDYWKYISVKGYVYCLGAKFKYINPDEKMIEKGFILANHRSWNDFSIDPYISNASFVGRHVATIATLFGALLAMLDNRYISIDRNNKRGDIFDILVNHMKKDGKYCKKMMYWPEGTRRNHVILNSIDETKSMIKPGMLKSIYEYKELPIQIMITKNKENMLNEKKIFAQYGITLNISLSKAIYPENFNTFNDFYNEVCKVWYEQFNLTYK
jgi:1-acyl-sn-glycerol-3-phosphate acyltransferase